MRICSLYMYMYIYIYIRINDVYCMQNCLQGLFVDMLPKMIICTATVESRCVSCSMQATTTRSSHRVRSLVVETHGATKNLATPRRGVQRFRFLRSGAALSVFLKFSQFFSPDRSVLPMAQGSANAVPNFARQRPSVDLSCCAQVR